MHRTMTALLGVVGALVAIAPGQAAPSIAPHSVLDAASYAGPLRPIPNALETLGAIETAEADALKVQYYPPPYYYRPPPPPPPPYYRYPRYNDGYYPRYYNHRPYRYDGGPYRRW